MKFAAAALSLCLATPALAQSATDPFRDGPGYAKIHVASGFVCPAAIGPFERDAQGEYDVQTGADICSYAALDGVYGTIVLTPLSGPYDPKASLAPQFVEQEGTGGKQIGEKTIGLGAKSAPLSVFTRTYRTARAESMDYRTLFAGTQIGNWAVEVTMEYADPRDTPAETAFLNAVFVEAAKDMVPAAK
ncbi:MAG TPA: hypothetical protein VLC29_10710 [Rhizomicrobium sp.]|nr:hypothetical protein [Rhizomicrobium sp.]